MAQRKAQLVDKLLAPLERDLQEAAAQWLELCLPLDAWFCHIPNEGKRGSQGQRMAKRSGLKTGAPDLIIAHRCRLLAIELKRQGSGRISPAQTACHADLEAAGVPTMICRPLDEVQAALISWDIPLRRKLR